LGHRGPGDRQPVVVARRLGQNLAPDLGVITVTGKGALKRTDGGVARSRS
jgi:hypothetical protein